MQGFLIAVAGGFVGIGMLHGVTNDVIEALRFAREVDAERYAYAHLSNTAFKVKPIEQCDPSVKAVARVSNGRLSFTPEWLADDDWEPLPHGTLLYLHPPVRERSGDAT